MNFNCMLPLSIILAKSLSFNHSKNVPSIFYSTYDYLPASILNMPPTPAAPTANNGLHITKFNKG